MDEKKKEKIVKFFREILEMYDFQIKIEINKDLENVFKLIDIQKGNLGGIEQEEFYTLADIIDRLDIYHQDYIYTPLENRQFNNETLPKDDWDLVAKRYFESDTVADVLYDIGPKEYTDLIGKEEKFEIQDIIKILDEDEEFYKSVCQKYVDTMSKEMLIEKDNKILHIFIQDEYINLKEKGKINRKNYKNYLDENFEVYEYDFYQDFYNSTVKDKIAYDLNDLELFDKDGNWNFYLTFEELKKFGYAFMVKDHFPLIEKYAVSDEKIFEFFDYFSLEQLEDFEQSLYLYYVTNDIVFDGYGLVSREGYLFNGDIIKLSEGLITYEDFIADNKNKEPSKNEIILSKVIEYFKENKIKDLMDYGSDNDEGLFKLSSMYKDIMDELNIKYSNIYTDDVSDGKYLTTITFANKTSINIDTSAWNGRKVVAENIKSVYDFYENLKLKTTEKDKKNYEEINYIYD